MSRRVALATLVVITALPCGVSAQSTATGVFAKRLLVKNAVPDDERKNRLVVIAKDATIVFPTPGSFGDPRCFGGSTSVITVGGLSHTPQALSCLNWTLLGREEAPKGYRYKDRELDQAAVKSIVWKPGLLKMVLKGSGPTFLDVDLIPGVPVTIPVEVTFFVFNSGYCVACGPVAGKDGSDGKTFLGKSCAAPGFCISSPSGAFLD